MSLNAPPSPGLTPPSPGLLNSTSELTIGSSVLVREKVRPLGRDVLWSDSRYAVLFSNLDGIDAKDLALRLDWLAAHNPHLALDRLHARGSSEHRDPPANSAPSSSILSVHQPVPGKGPHGWVQDFFATDHEAILRVCLVGEDCFFVVSHVLGDFAGVIALCEFVLLGGDGHHLEGLKPTGFPVIGRAMLRALRRHPMRLLRAPFKLLPNGLRKSLGPRQAGVAAHPGPIRLICWPKGISNGSDTHHRSAPSIAEITLCAIRAADALGIPYHPKVSILVNCRHWLERSGRPLLGNLATVTPVMVSPDVHEREVTRQLMQDFRENLPLTRLALTHLYGAARAAFAGGKPAPQAAVRNAEPPRLVITNLGEIQMMTRLRRAFPRARFSGTPAMPIEGSCTLVVFSDMQVDHVGIISNCQLTADDAERWTKAILDMLHS